MAVTAKFQADFSSFLSAIDKAEVALVDFSKGANKVETSLNRMVDNFSGRKLIQEASLMTIAIEKAGGTSKLTARELETVGAKANDAADKMRRLGYEVPAGLQKLADETKGATRSFDGLTKSISGIASAFGIVFGAAAVVNFGKQLLDDADALTKLHDVTGISIEGLQRFQIAGDDAGNTLDEITSAIVKMEDKLASGDKSAVSALKKLGISFEDIKGLSPENQFTAISRAMQEIQDPAEQVNIAIDLFGKAGANILPTLKRGFDDLTDSTQVWSEETVKAWDDAGDAIARWWRAGKGIIAEAIVGFVHLAEGGFHPVLIEGQEMVRVMETVNAQIKAMTKAAEAHAPKMKALAPPGLPDDLEDIYRELDKTQKALEQSAQQAKKFKDELARNGEAARHAEPYFFGLSQAVGAVDNSELEAVRASIVLRGEIDKVEQAAHVAEFGFKGMADGLNQIGEKAAVAIKPIQTLGLSLKNSLLTSLQSIPQTLANAFTGGGGLGGALKSIASDLGASIGATIGKTFASLGRFAGPIGAAIGSLGGPLVGLFGKLFDNPEKKINPIRQAFIDSAGGLSELNKKAHEAGVTLDRLLNAKNPEQYQAAIEELNGALERHKQIVESTRTTYDNVVTKLKTIHDISPELQKALDAALSAKTPQDFLSALQHINTEIDTQIGKQNHLNELVTKYGLDWTKASESFKTQKINEQAQGLIDDFNDLKVIFPDLNVLMRSGFGKSIEDFVKSAQAAKVEIPESMRPVIQTAIDAGRLFDQNGKKISDMSELGLIFGEDGKSAFEKVQTAIERLATVLETLLGPNLDETTRKLGDIVDRAGKVPRNPFEQWGGGADFGGEEGRTRMHSGGVILPFVPRAHRGLAIDEVPIIAQTGEGILNRDAMQRIGGAAGLNALNAGGSSGSGVHIVIINGMGKTAEQIAAEAAEALPDRVIRNDGGVGSRLRIALQQQVTRRTA